MSEANLGYQKNLPYNDSSIDTSGEKPVVLKTAELNGNKVAFSSETEFLVQIRSRKGKYKTKYSFRGNLAQAVFYYNCINIGNGYCKRLLMPSSKKPVLAKQMS